MSNPEREVTQKRLPLDLKGGEPAFLLIKSKNANDNFVGLLNQSSHMASSAQWPHSHPQSARSSSSDACGASGADRFQALTVPSRRVRFDDKLMDRTREVFVQKASKELKDLRAFARQQGHDCLFGCSCITVTACGFVGLYSWCTNEGGASESPEVSCCSQESPREPRVPLPPGHVWRGARCGAVPAARSGRYM